MRSTSCYAVLSSTNGHQINASYSENNLTTNGKKSTTRVDILQSKKKRMNNPSLKTRFY